MTPGPAIRAGRYVRLGVWIGVTTLAVSLSSATPAQLSNSSNFLTLFNAYRSGDAEEAIRIFATWSPRRVETEAKFTAEADDPWDFAALALFHTETLRRSWGGAGEVNLARADSLMADLYRRAVATNDVRLKTFCRDWHIVELPRRNAAFFEIVRSRFADDPAAQLAAGTWAEFWMGPIIEGGSADSYWFQTMERAVAHSSHGAFGPEWLWAEDSFRRALALDPRLVEARLRLGRVYALLDRRSDAERELLQAQNDAAGAGNSAVGYLAGVFLGHLYETMGRAEPALNAYRTAVALYPSGQAGNLALSRLLVATGRGAEGWDAAFQAVEPRQSRVGPDPWVTYPRGRVMWELYPNLRRLRMQVRR